jgi:hypothetical protein
LTGATGPLRTTPLVVAEAAYLIGRRIGPKAEARWHSGPLSFSGEGDVEAAISQDLTPFTGVPCHLAPETLILAGPVR